MSLSDDDLLNNAKPVTRQRFEHARARRKSKENSFQVVIPSSVQQGAEALAQQARQARVHWEYSPEEWALFDRIDWKLGRRIFFWLLCFGFALGILALSGFSLAGFGISALLMLVMLFFLWISHYTEAAERHKARQKSAQPHRITISKQGIWIAGTYFSLENLAKVKMTPRPPVLRFHSFSVYTDSATADTAASYRRRVLVPRGREEEAERLVQRFRTEVIEAREEALQRWRNPPEPVS